MDAGGDFTRLTTDAGSDWAGHELPDGSIVFLSSRDGQNTVYQLSRGATDRDRNALRQLTEFAPDDEVSIGHGVHQLTVSADGSTAAFVVWDTLYTLDLTRRNSRPVAVRVTTTSDDDISEHEVIDVSQNASEFAWHPSGDVVAIVARGEIWLRSTEEDQPTRRITNTPWDESDVAWAPDGSVLYFVADSEESIGSIHAASVALSREDLAGASVQEDRDQSDEDAEERTREEDASNAATQDGDKKPDEVTDGTEDEGQSEPNRYGERWAAALTFSIEPVIAGETWDRAPSPSPDGHSVLFVRGLGDLIHLDLKSGDERVVFEGWNVPDVQWMPDSRHIVYERSDLDFNSDIWLFDLEAVGIDAAINLTQHPDIDTSPRLSADGKVLVFLSDRAGQNWNYDVHRIYLDKALEDLQSYELAQYFEDATKSAKQRKPLPPVSRDDEHETTDDDAEAMTLGFVCAE